MPSRKTNSNTGNVMVNVFDGTHQPIPGKPMSCDGLLDGTREFRSLTRPTPLSEV